jgi:ferritin-like metal-binding protein YciE
MPQKTVASATSKPRKRTTFHRVPNATLTAEKRGTTRTTHIRMTGGTHTCTSQLSAPADTGTVYRIVGLLGEVFFRAFKFQQPTGESKMGLFTKDIKTMEDMFLHGLQDIYYAEHQITKALPKMIEQSTNRDLATGLRSHLEETKGQIERLKKVFHKLGKEPQATDCPAIDGIIKEADETAGEIDNKQILDAAIVANSQAVEHYEIARYGTLIAWAEELGHDDVVRFLTTNLNEEKAANTKLNALATRKGVNNKAVNAA